MKDTSTHTVNPVLPSVFSRAENLRLNIEEFSKGETILLSRPPVLFIELTQNCNLHCKMCRSANGYQKSLNMERSLFEKIKRDLIPYASIVDLRGWGESTVLKNFSEYVSETAIAGTKLRLVTNALAINEKLWKLLMENGVSVVVSVDASTPETMLALERGSFEKLMHSLEIGTRERNKHGVRGTISFNTVITALNLSELSQIVQIAANFGINRVTMFPVVASRKNPLHLDNRKTEIPFYLSQAEELAKENNIELRLGASLHEEFVVQEGLPSRCSHPWEYCYIDYAGNVGYCDHLIGNTALTFGNLMDSTFEEIWNGVKFQELRYLHSKAKQGGTDNLNNLFPHCNWCYMRRYVDFEDETNTDSHPRIVSTTGKHPLIVKSSGPFCRTDFMSWTKLI